MNTLKFSCLLVCYAISLSCLCAQTGEDPNNADFSGYNNFDFIAGTKVLFYDDFTSGLTKWNITEFDAADDVEKPSIKKITNDQVAWFKTPRRGRFFPPSVKTLPESFTIEFDMWADMKTMSEMQGGLKVIFVSNKTKREDYDYIFNDKPQIQLDIHPSQELLYCSAMEEYGRDERELEKKKIKNGWKVAQSHRISISRNKTHIRLYVNEKKFIDLPNGLPKKEPYTLVMATDMWGDGLYFTNFRLAEATEQPAKFDKEGKFVTNAIYFDVNSAKIKSESWAALNQVASAIKSVQGKITVIGHTDSDGGKEFNLNLSKKRAESVKQALVKNFGIDASRLLTDGKGASEPVDKNNTPEGKANNRRVEFVLTKP
jgi:outer membrane protein OmpA-like peptidoglycan-associated protein